MSAETVAVKIHSRVFERKRKRDEGGEDGFVEKQWKGTIEPVLTSLATETPLPLPTEVYLSQITDLKLTNSFTPLQAKLESFLQSHIESQITNIIQNPKAGETIITTGLKLGLFFQKVTMFFEKYRFGKEFLREKVQEEEVAGVIKKAVASKLSSEEASKNFSELRDSLAQVLRFLELIYAKITNHKVIKKLLSEAKKAKTDKMRDLCYYYANLYMQNVLVNRDLEVELYATLLDLFETSSVDEIGVLYSCCSNSGLTTALLKNWQKLLEHKGQEQIEHILKEEKTHIVENLMEFKKKTDSVIESAFNNNSEFRMGQKKAFEVFINQDANKISEYIAKYLDLHLRKSVKTKIIHTDEEMEHIIQDTLTIFKFCHAKDVFQAFYLKGLSTRLLHKRSLSNDAEKYVLFVLKKECGEEFTQKIEGMLKDISTSEVIMKEYFASLSDKPENCEIKVLTQGNWPIQSRVQVKIPQELSPDFKKFADYYKMKYNGKALKFSPYLSYCTLEGTFGLKNKDKTRTILIEVNLLQTAVLMLFNQKDQFSFEEILTELDLEEETLESVLVSLCSMQYKVLKKSNRKTRNVKKDESFTVDDNFKPKLKKISITATTKKQAQQESEETHVRVLEDRKYLLEAMIVQLMKKNNKMEHVALINEIFSKVKFPLTHSVIKDRIESLIARDYMEPSEDNPNIYLYVA